MTISVAILALNAGETLERVLKSVSWADEIVVLVDSNSTDNTIAIAKKFTKKVATVKHVDMFHLNRQKAIDKTTGDWVLNIDSDEELTPELSEEIQTISKNTSHSGFRIPRRNMVFGKWLGYTGWYPDYQLKLFRHGKGQLPCKSLHEDIVIDGTIGTLNNDLLHHHYQSVGEFMEHLVRYTENDAEFLQKKGETVVWSDAIKFPADEFLKRFFYWEGYKDGLHGLVLSLLQAFSRLVVFARLWEKEKFKEFSPSDFKGETHKHFKNVLKNYYYWLIKSESNPAKNAFYKLFRRTIV